MKEMKIPVDIRADDYFMKQCESLILQKINEILGSEQNVKKYMEGLIEKYTKRRDQKTYEETIEKLIINQKFTEGYSGYSWKSKQHKFTDYIKERIDKIVETKVKKYLEDVVFSKIKLFVGDNEQ